MPRISSISISAALEFGRQRRRRIDDLRGALRIRPFQHLELIGKALTSMIAPNAQRRGQHEYAPISPSLNYSHIRSWHQTAVQHHIGRIIVMFRDKVA